LPGQLHILAKLKADRSLRRELAKLDELLNTFASTKELDAFIDHWEPDDARRWRRSGPPRGRSRMSHDDAR
jgi:hypothetical protein